MFGVRTQRQRLNEDPGNSLTRGVGFAGLPDPVVSAPSLLLILDQQLVCHMADLLLAQFWERDWGDEAIFAEGVLQHVRRPPPDHDPMVSPPPILQAKTVRKQVVRRPAATAQEEPNPRILTRKVTEVMDTRGVGFTFRLARDAWTPDFYIKRMQWWKAGTRWHCEWEWTPYDRTAWHDLCSKGQAPSDVDAFDRVMKAQARGLPLEILLHMVHKSRHPRIQRKDNDTLATFALVCSSWYDLCAPSLYHTIAVQTFRAKDFLDCIRAPHSRIPRYTKTVHVRGTHSWALYARLSGYLPNVVMVHCSDLSISRLDPASLGSYPPSCPRISGGLLRRLEHVKNIRLSYCRFDSSLHLLRLLGSFPALKYATLTGISCKSSFVAPPTNVTPSRLNYIHTLDCHPLWPLALSWRWPHPSADASASGFPGLLDFEMRLVTDLVQSVQLHNDVDLFLDGSPTDLSVCE